MRKRPQVDSAALQEQNTNLARNRRNRTRHGYRTRAAREEEQEEEFEVGLINLIKYNYFTTSTTDGYEIFGL